MMAYVPTDGRPKMGRPAKMWEMIASFILLNDVPLRCHIILPSGKR